MALRKTPTDLLGNSAWNAIAFGVAVALNLVVLPFVVFRLGVAAFGVGVWAGNLHALPADAFPPQKVATVYGLAGSAGAVGGVLFNYLVGYFTVRSNYHAIFAMLLLLQPLGAAGLWLFLKAPAVSARFDE